MTAKIQHVSLKVADIAKSAAFYEHVFGGVVRTIPLKRSGAFVERLLGAPEGIAQRGIHISLPQGGIELAQLSLGDDIVAPADVPAWKRRILHFCIEVEDVRAVAARVESAGGRLQFPVTDETGQPFVYVEDPDGHVIEVLQMTFEEAVETVHRFVPGSKPEPRD